MDFAKQIIFTIFLIFSSIFVWDLMITAQASDTSSSNNIATSAATVVDSVSPCKNGETRDCINMDKCIVNIAGYNYDLSPLQKSSGNIIFGEGTGYDVYFNFCDEISFQSISGHELFSSQCGDSSVAMIYEDKNTCYSFGIDMSMSANFFLPLTGMSGLPESGISLTMDDESGRKTLIRLNCNTKDYCRPPQSHGLSQGKLQISWDTPHGCPIKDMDDSHNESTKSIGSPDEPVNIPHAIQNPGYINHHNVTLNVTDGSCNIVYSIDEVICYGVSLYRNRLSESNLIDTDNTICIFIFWLIVTNKRLHIVNDERKFAKDIIKWLIQLRMMSWFIATYPH